MENLTVLVTGCGAPGIKGTLYSLEKNFDGKKIRTVGTDIREDAVGCYLCNRFYKISKPTSENYLSQLLNICKKEQVNVLLPQNTAELSILAEHKNEFEISGTVIAVSDKNAIDMANDKNSLLSVAQEIGVPVPRFYLAHNKDELLDYAQQLGWPQMRVVVKPPVSNGMRGLRIIDESTDRKKMFYQEKPSSVYMKMKDLLEILGERFPALQVTEYLPGDEYTVDVLSAGKLTIVPRSRDRIVSGITFDGTVKYNRDIIDFSEKLSKKIGLKYAFGFQFKLDDRGRPRLLESNPRIQGTMVLATFAGANVIYGAVKHALREDVPEFEISWGTRILRYWGGLGIKDQVLGAL
ncbi:MAG: ATP-grasp domain-containing protein [Methanothrix sp.]|nr:ATP-grasp domain-containing protein [Methanothrix sp.]